MKLDLEAAKLAFRDNFKHRGEIGASVSVWQGGEEVLSLAAGFRDRSGTFPWDATTPVLVWSATKGPAAACVLHALHHYGIPLETKVAGLWPEFAAAGKERVTIRQLLCHQAGLSALEIAAEVTDHDAVTHALERQAPLWPPGSAHGYHPRTFGFLADEVVRRVTGGTSLGDYWKETFAGPMGLEFWMGIDEAHLERVSPVFPAKAGEKTSDSAFYSALVQSDSLTAAAFSSPKGLHSVAAMNTPEARQASFPAFGGIGTASALGKFYAMLAADGRCEGHAFFAEGVLEEMLAERVSGPDLVLQVETCFSAGFMRDPLRPDGQKVRTIFGPSTSAFGHPGAGGSLAFADPENDVAFVYVMNQMAAGVLPNEKSLRIVSALYG